MSKRERSIFRKRLILQPRSAKRKTYLLAWNPKRWSWNDIDDNIDKHIQEVNEKGFSRHRWTCGKNRSISKGDRIFLIKLGEEPKGIVASGIVERESYEDEHLFKLYGRSLYVDIKFDVLSKEPIISIDFLKKMSEKFSWSTRVSGIKIQEPVAKDLEAEWSKRTKGSAKFIPEELDDSGVFPEGAKHRISVNAYERNPQARQACIEYYGTNCKVCGFSFREFYGKDFKDYIIVHHLVPISKIGESYQIDAIKDLIPVCPNCHYAIHSREPIYSIEELKKIKNE